VSETAWSGSNGGYSQTFPRPSYQNGIHSNAYRGVPDVAANADPSTGYQICFSGYCFLVGGITNNFFLCQQNLQIKNIFIFNKKAHRPCRLFTLP
jgi:hypothetical protein